MSNPGHILFKGLCFINGASYDQSLYEIHIYSKSYNYGLSVYLIT